MKANHFKYKKAQLKEKKEKCFSVFYCITLSDVLPPQEIPTEVND